VPRASVINMSLYVYITSKETNIIASNSN